MNYLFQFFLKYFERPLLTGNSVLTSTEGEKVFRRSQAREIKGEGKPFYGTSRTLKVSEKVFPLSTTAFVRVNSRMCLLQTDNNPVS